MKSVETWLRWMLLAAMTVSLGWATTQPVEAGDAYSHPCYYKTVVRHVPRQVTYVVRVRAYTPCGKPYWRYQTRSKTVSVAVKYRMKVCN